MSLQQTDAFRGEEWRDALAILRKGVVQAGGKIRLAASFSLEDLVIIDLIRRHDLPIGLFAIDTGRLHEETYATAEAVRERYGLEILWYVPQAPALETLVQEKGFYSFRESLENRHECCQIRKVEPLQRALAGLAGWVTGQRRAHGVTRQAIEPIETDELHGGILKVNPLVFWQDEELWSYADEYRLPVNRLQRQGYPSIGCAPCTRAVAAGEDPRSGRWWWEQPGHRECGLHRR